MDLLLCTFEVGYFNGFVLESFSGYVLAWTNVSFNFILVLLLDCIWSCRWYNG